MKQFFLVLSVLAMALVLSLSSSCSKTSSIGSDLVGEDQAEVTVVDTLSITARNIRVDSVQTYGSSDAQQSNSYLVGKYEDPIFGKVEASIFAQINLNESSNPGFADGAGRLDSVVLSLVYDSLKTYGNIASIAQKWEIYMMDETMDRAADYYSDQTFSFDPTPIGETTFIPAPEDSISYVDYIFGAGDTVTRTNMLRIPLSREFGAFLLSLSADDLTNSDNFKNKVPGIHIKAIDETEAMLGFVLSNEFSRINLYYRDTDAAPREYQFPFLFPSPKMNNFVNDYTGTEVEQFLANPELADSLIFIHSMAGVNAEIDIPYVDELPDVIINEAILEFFIASETNSLFSPVDRLYFAREDSDGDLILIDDILFAIATLQNLDVFGGSPVEDEQLSIMKYRMNITDHFQDMVDGDEETTMSIFPRLSRERSDRVVLYGPKHSTYPMRLKVTYTNL